jgi:hypothetical protein
MLMEISNLLLLFTERKINFLAETCAKFVAIGFTELNYAVFGTAIF